MFICENITCVRGGATLFKNLGFCLQEGSILLLKGANGCGKTSLIEILAGKLAPEVGEVSWNGTAADMMYIGHNSDIREDLSAEDNVIKWAKKYGSESLIKAALSFYDLTDYKDIKAGHLSAGVKRRLALSHLIVAPCKLWLLDEPTNFLDEDALLLTTSLIETRVKQGGIVIVATHIMNSAIDAHTLNLEDFNI